MFFFEKKNQKTFAPGLRSLAALLVPGSGCQLQKFFGSFFQKRTTSFAGPRDRGFALLIVLWTMVLLALLTAQITGAGRAEVQLAAAMRQSAQLEAAADGAIYETIWHMTEGGGDMWAPGNGVYTLREATGPVQVEVIDDRGKFDINQVPPGLLAGLFGVLGMDTASATTLANAIGDWRSQTPGTDADQNVPPEYRMEGRAWGPAGAEFERLEELKLVRGMTPALYAAALPYLTLSLEQGPWLQYAGPMVQAAIQKAKRTAGITVEAADARGPVVLQLNAVAYGPGGSRCVRHVLMRFDGTLSGPAWKYRILEWE